MRKLWKHVLPVMLAVCVATAVPGEVLAQEVQEIQGETENNTSEVQDNEETQAETQAEVKQESETQKTEQAKDSASLTLGSGEDTKKTTEEEPVTEEDGDPGEGRLQGDVPTEFYDGRQLRAASGNYVHNSRFSGYKITEGIDVSKWNGNIDWKKVKNDGIKYAFIRVGYRSYGKSGSLGMDSKAVANLKGAIAAGVPVGVYIFSQAITTSEAVAEANYILKAIKGYKISLSVVFDYEYAYDSKGKPGRLYNARLSRTAATNICMAFCNKVKSSGYTPMVYANKSMLTNSLNASTISAKYPTWLANYTTKTTYAGAYTFWQYTSSGKVNGISGKVDRNFWYKSYPSTVSGLKVYGRNTNSITLRWNAAGRASGYRVYRYSGGKYTKLADVSGKNSVTYTNKSLKNGTKYTYMVRSYCNSDGIRYYGGYSANVSGTTTKPASTRLGKTTLKAKGSAFDKVKLTWKKVSGASGYYIQRYNSSKRKYETIKTITKGSTTGYTNSSLNASTTYKYRIRAYKKSGSKKTYGSYSSAVKAKTKKAVRGKSKATRLNVRKGAGTSYKSYGKIGKGVKMTVKGSRGSWYKVSVKVKRRTRTGYIKKSYIKLY